MTEEEEHKFWAQMIRHRDSERILKGGHGVPLSGELPSIREIGTATYILTWQTT
jgi:hypothetical protein